MFIDLREEGREGGRQRERERGKGKRNITLREKHPPVASCVCPDRDGTHNLMLYRMNLQPTAPPGQGNTFFSCKFKVNQAYREGLDLKERNLWEKFFGESWLPIGTPVPI